MGRKPDLTNLTHEKRQELFLAQLRKEPNITIAARAAGWSRGYVYQLRDEDPEFREAWQEALDESVDLAESEVHRRAFKGTLKPVYQGGLRVGGIREYSDTLAIFLLKAHRPEKYRDQVRHEHGGVNGPAIRYQHDGEACWNLSRLSVGDLLTLRELAAKVEDGADNSGDPDAPDGA